MAKKKSASYMTGGEQVAGTVLFVVYFAVLPLAAGPLFSAAEFLLGHQLFRSGPQRHHLLHPVCPVGHHFP